MKLSITHKLASDHGVQRDIGEARQSAPRDGSAGRRIAGAGEITAEPGDLGEIEREYFLSCVWFVVDETIERADFCRSETQGLVACLWQNG